MEAPTTPPQVGRLSVPRPPKLVEAELAGGLHALFVRRPSLPLIELRLVFPLATTEIVKPAPLAVLSRSLFAGTDDHDRLALAGEIEGLGGQLEAYADEDRFVVSGSALADHLGALLGLLAEVLTGARYPMPEVRADRSRAADETVIALSQPGTIASQALRRRLFAGHPYATPIPTPGALRRVADDALGSLHPMVLDPGAAHLVIVGDLQPARARALADDAVGSWLARREPGRSEPPPLGPPKPGPLEIVARPGSLQTNVRLGGRAPSLADPDWPATSLAEGVLGGMFSSRIVANLRERNGYTYSPGSHIRHRRAGSSLVLVADVATESTAPALVETFYELGRIATTGVTEEELDQARHYLVGRFGFATASLPSLASMLAGLAVNGVGLGYLTSYPKAVIASTKREVDDAARRYLAPGQLVTVVVGDADAVAKPLSALGDVVVRSA